MIEKCYILRWMSFKSVISAQNYIIAVVCVMTFTTMMLEQSIDVPREILNQRTHTHYLWPMILWCQACLFCWYRMAQYGTNSFLLCLTCLNIKIERFLTPIATYTHLFFPILTGNWNFKNPVWKTACVLLLLNQDNQWYLS